MDYNKSDEKSLHLCRLSGMPAQRIAGPARLSLASAARPTSHKPCRVASLTD